MKEFKCVIGSIQCVIGGEDVTLVPYWDCDISLPGIDVYDKNGTLIYERSNIELPDVDDEDFEILVKGVINILESEINF